jgi:hypothetical protein
MGAPEGNKFAVGNNGGRPRMYNGPDDMAPEIDSYFEWCRNNAKPYTVTGLALWLGFSDKSMLYEYQDRKEFSHLIKRARMEVEMGYETNLHGNTATGSIFALKNMGWKDKSETELSGNMGVVWQETKTYQKPEDGPKPEANPGN